jgi:hypothetical protein
MDGRNDLRFRGDQTSLEDFASRLAAAGGDWVRDFDAEAVAASVLGRPAPGYRFFHRKPQSDPDAQLRLSPRNSAEMDATVVPVGRPGYPFTPAEWNHFLADFAAVADPHARAARVQVVGPAPRRVELADHTTFTTAALAEQFRSAADPANLTASDRSRWRAFTVRAYRDDRPPSDDVIRDWLTQHGWSAAQIEPLLADYDGAFQLLQEYEEAART